MNLFRSEEHVKGWSQYDPISEEAIMPLSDWAHVFSGPIFRHRLAPDYLARTPEYTEKHFSTLKKLGKTGPFWFRS